MAAIFACSIGAFVSVCVFMFLGSQWVWSRKVAGGLVDVPRFFREVGAWGLRARIVPPAVSRKALVVLREMNAFGFVCPAVADDWELMGIALCANVAFALVSWAFTGSCLILPIALAMPWACCAMRARVLEKHHKERIAAGMPSAFMGLAASLGSGLSLPQALGYVGSHSDGAIGDEFVRASCSMRCGESVSEALREMLDNLGASGLEMVVLALEVSQRTGAPLGKLLGDAARSAGERLDLRRELDVKTAQARASARLVTAMPLVMVTFLTLTSPDFRSGLVTPVGMASVVAALGLDVLAWFLIRKIMDVKI